jgi:excisionase family DNA binding protein
VERLLTTEEVADLLRTTASTVRYWRHVGTGPRGFRAGRRVLYAEADIEAWIAQQRATEQAHGRTQGLA